MHSACPCHSLACALMLVQVGDAVLPVKLLPEEAALVLKHGFVSLSLLSPLRGAGAGGDAVVEELGTGAGGGRITIPHVPPRQNATVREGGSVLALRRGESVEEGWGLMMDAAEAGVGDGAQWRTLWRFPSTEDEERRMRVFEDLWAQGFWVTDGLKFGATFLAYQGDPRDHHASHLVTVAAANEPFPAIGLVAKGRVATAANKRCVLASFERVMDDGGSVQEGKGALVYTTIEFEPSLSSARSAAFD